MNALSPRQASDKRGNAAETDLALSTVGSCPSTSGNRDREEKQGDLVDLGETWVGVEKRRKQHLAMASQTQRPRDSTAGL